MDWTAGLMQGAELTRGGRTYVINFVGGVSGPSAPPPIPSPMTTGLVINFNLVEVLSFLVLS